MKNAALGALALASFCSGCLTTQQAEVDFSAAIVTVGAKVAAAQTTIKKLAADTQTACAYIQPSVGYFLDVADAVSPAALAAGQLAQSYIDATCALASSTSLPDVVNKLGQAWAVEQAATKTP